MDRTYWHKQTSDKPLFTDILWSRPENKRTAGKLLIIGGNSHGFAAVGDAYQAATVAGIGTARALMPDALQKVIGNQMLAAEFAPSTPAGSFSQTALADTLEQANWAEAILFAGDLGRNSETAILIEKFLDKSTLAVTLTKDAADYAIKLTPQILDRNDTLLVISIAQAQQLFKEAASSTPITFSMDMLHLVDALHEFTAKYSVNLIVKHIDHLYVGVDGEVSTNPTELDVEENWRVATAARAAVWWLQNPTKPFEALTTSIMESLPLTDS